LYRSLRRAKIEGLNVYRREHFPKHFRFGTGKSELMLPIVLTADRGFWIEKPKTHSEDSDESEDDANDDVAPNVGGVAPEATGSTNQAEDPGNKRLGVHGYDPLHVPEMNGALIAFGPDLARGRTVAAIEQADVYALACRLLNMTCPAVEGSQDELLERFLRSDDDDDDDDKDDDKDNSSQESDEQAQSAAAAGSAGASSSGSAGGDDDEGSASGKPNKSRSRWANRSSAVTIYPHLNRGLMVTLATIALASSFI
jgi:hypothetical protein